MAAAAAAAAAAVPLTAAAAAAPAPAVLARVAPADAAEVLGGAARPVLPRGLGRPARATRGPPAARAARPLPPPGRRRGGRASRRRPGSTPGPAVRAAVEPAPAPPPADCRAAPEGGWPAFDPVAATPDLSGYQDYRTGMDVPDSAAGAGVRIADVEYEWRTHPRGARRAGARRAGPPAGGPARVRGRGPRHRRPRRPRRRRRRRGHHRRGARRADLAAVALLRARPRPATTCPGRSPRRRSRCGPGDVLLIEQQTEYPTPSGEVFAPVEADPAMRDLIRAVVDGGVVVVEPAGNGGRDLASLGLPWLADPAHPDASGALLVAGGELGRHRGRPRPDGAGSNYGARVDLQGYGAGVVTSRLRAGARRRAAARTAPTPRASTAPRAPRPRSPARWRRCRAWRSPAPARRSRPPSSAPRSSGPGSPRPGPRRSRSAPAPRSPSRRA